jgi:DNA-binding transcriptional regulator YdaS (Cro superfamily)
MDKLTEYLDEERGRRYQLAKALGITPGAVHQWKKCPPARAADVSRLTGIPVTELRPDVFRTSEEARA